MTQNSCRHFLGLFPSYKPSCKKGRDVRAWAVRCNDGSGLGIGLRLPCTKRSDDAEKPLFDCPELDRETDAEIEQQNREVSERMDRIVAGMPAINAMRRKMVKHQLATAKANCPWCGEKDALQVSCAISVNNHMRVKCRACGEGFME